jgi:hypothetical protein
MNTQRKQKANGGRLKNPPSPQKPQPRRPPAVVRRPTTLTTMRRSVAPVSIATRIQAGDPTISESGSGRLRSMRIKHCELLNGTLATSINWTLSVYQVNPGLSTTFQWLAPIAQQWEQYRVHRFVVKYIPVQPTGTAGDVILTPEYDVLDNPPNSEIQQSDMSGSVTQSVWTPFNMEFDQSAMMALGPRRFVRATNMAGDLKTYDVGNIYIGTVNNPNNGAVAGKVYIEYDIEFFVPQTNRLTQAVPSTVTKFASQGLNTIGATGIQLLLSLGSPAVPTLGGNNPLRITYPTGYIFVLPAGSYRVQSVLNLLANTASADAEYQLVFLRNNIVFNTYQALFVHSGSTINACGMMNTDDLVTSAGSDNVSFGVTQIATTGGNTSTLVQAGGFEVTFQVI